MLHVCAHNTPPNLIVYFRNFRSPLTGGYHFWEIIEKNWKLIFFWWDSNLAILNLHSFFFWGFLNSLDVNSAEADIGLSSHSRHQQSTYRGLIWADTCRCMIPKGSGNPLYNWESPHLLPVGPIEGSGEIQIIIAPLKCHSFDTNVYFNFESKNRAKSRVIKYVQNYVFSMVCFKKKMSFRLLFSLRDYSHILTEKHPY